MLLVTELRFNWMLTVASAPLDNFQYYFNILQYINMLLPAFQSMLESLLISL